MCVAKYETLYNGQDAWAKSLTTEKEEHGMFVLNHYTLYLLRVVIVQLHDKVLWKSFSSKWIRHIVRIHKLLQLMQVAVNCISYTALYF